MAKKNLSILLSVAVSVFLLGILAVQIDIQDLMQTFANIYYPALLAFMAIAFTAAALRALRYKLLLRPYPISFGNILLVTFIRNLFVDLLPARIGSLSYIYVLNKKLKYSFEAATSTFVLSFLLDFLTLSPFLILSIIFVGIGTISISNATILLCFSLIFLAFFALILWKIVPVFSMLFNLYKFLLKTFHLEKKKWALISQEKFSLTISCLFQIKKNKIEWPIFLLSLLIRLAKYGSLYSLLFALMHSHGFLLTGLSFWKTILGITGAEFTSILPVKGIAGFGTWESAWALTFQLMDFESRFAIISGIGIHLITNIFEYSLGICAILILSLPFHKNAASNKNP